MVPDGPPHPGWDTRLVHAGEEIRVGGAIVMPIFQSAMFEESERIDDQLLYIRYTNLPNHRALQMKLAALEGAEDALLFASGMAAISTALLTVLKAGDHLLAQEGLYGGTHALLTQELPTLGIEVDFVRGDDLEQWERCRKPNTRAIYVETISNPLLNVAPLDRLASFARTAGLVSLIDNTMATPLLFRPLEWGYDLSLHSATKYLNGHSDIVGGALLGRREWVGRARTRLQRWGGSMDPHQCFLLARGVKTLALRLHRQSESAGALAAMIAKDSRVRSVRYPGLSNDASYANARRLLDGFGALLAFDLGSAAAAERFMGALGLAMHAPSFGGVETLVTRPALSSHASLSAAERESLGIGDGLVRLAAGIESTEDLLEDVRQALEWLGEDV